MWSKIFWRFLRLFILFLIVGLLLSVFVKQSHGNYPPALLPLIRYLKLDTFSTPKKETLVGRHAAEITRTNDWSATSAAVQRIIPPTMTNAPKSTRRPVKQTKKVVRPTTIKFPNISDTEVVEALNRYRDDHKVHHLIIDKNLCDYAEKRVKDLLAYGGLDHHAGFKKDFADQKNLPEPIKRYSGRTIGENLAYQYCRNMTTGDSFIAQTGTALIEWCFDSSTAGHREAQLNPTFNAVCVRHAKGYYVVIFGE